MDLTEGGKAIFRLQVTWVQTVRGTPPTPEAASGELGKEASGGEPVSSGGGLLRVSQRRCQSPRGVGGQLRGCCGCYHRWRPHSCPVQRGGGDILENTVILVCRI